VNPTLAASKDAAWLFRHHDLHGARMRPSIRTLTVATLSATACIALAQGSAAKYKMTVAMPKTYDKSETMSLWGDYFKHLSSCANVELQNAGGMSAEQSFGIDTLAEKDLVEAVKSGKAQLAQVNPGLVAQLVTAGHPGPFAVPGNKTTGKKNSYKLLLITRLDSGIAKPTDLVGKKVAHTTPTSNSGNLAPRALFPAIGLTPDKDYEVVFSNGHERSISGVLYGFYPGAAVASDLFQRMIIKGEVRASSFRVLWESQPFMTESWIMGADVPADVQGRVRKCSYSYSFSPKLRTLLVDNDTFLPVVFENDFATVMEVYRKSRAAAEAAKAPK
jgi:phosphonate transport system substrate-binding protein